MSKKSIEKLSFEEALSELENIVQKIDNGGDDLATSIENFERGMELKKHCEKMLKGAKMKIEKITKAENGDISSAEVNI